MIMLGNSLCPGFILGGFLSLDSKLYRESNTIDVLLVEVDEKQIIVILEWFIRGQRRVEVICGIVIILILAESRE
jgi:hypothetical protein